MAFSKRDRAPSRTHGPANSDFYYDNEEDDEYVPAHKAPAKDKSCLGNKRAAPTNGAAGNGFTAAAFGFPATNNLTAAASKPNGNGKSRPTNNQLLYKAFVRWPHYTHPLVSGTDKLPVETDTCASVTAALLQVLQILHSAETQRQTGSKRNVLQILSANTRRTKVVELSSSTHRVPDELRKHYISDGEGGQYSTNLDRNKYGNDENYLFTVIKYDLEYLSLCPCLVDVEITDVKAGNSSLLVATGWEFCSCGKDPRAGAAGGPMGRHQAHGNTVKDALHYARNQSAANTHTHNTAMNAIAAPAAAFVQIPPNIHPQYQEHQAHPHPQQLQQLQLQPTLPQLQQQLQQQQMGFIPQLPPQQSDHATMMHHSNALLSPQGQLLQQQQLLASLPSLQQQQAAQQHALAADHQHAHHPHTHQLTPQQQQQQQLDTYVKAEDILLMPTRGHLAALGAGALTTTHVASGTAGQTAAAGSVLSAGRLSRGGRSASSGGAMGGGGGHNAHLLPAQPALSTGRSSSPRHSGSTSQLFDALVMAATGISQDSGRGLINQNGCTAGQNNHRNGNGLVPNTAGVCTRPGEQPQVTSGVFPAQIPLNPTTATARNNSPRGVGLSTPLAGNRQQGPTISSVLSGLTDMEGLLPTNGLTQSQDGGMDLELGNWADDSSLAGLCAGLDQSSTGLMFSTRPGESFGLRPPSPSTTAAAAAGGTASRQQHHRHSSSLSLQQPLQHKSRLCSTGTPSVDEINSLQNALQAFRETEENESREEQGLKRVRGWGSEAGGAAGAATEGSVGSADGGRATTSTASLRQRERRRKPDRGASGSAGGMERPVLGRSAESAPKPRLLQETSDENKAAGFPGKASASVDGQELAPMGHVMNTRTQSGVGGHKRSAARSGGTEEDGEAELGPEDMDAQEHSPTRKGSLYTVQQHKRQHRNPPRRQSSVAAMSTRAMPYEQARMLTAELEQARAENNQLRAENSWSAGHMPSTAGANAHRVTTRPDMTSNGISNGTGSTHRTMEQELAALRSELAAQASAGRRQEAAAASEAAALKLQLAAQATACLSAEEAAVSAAANLRAAKLQMDAIMLQIQAAGSGSNADESRIQITAILQGWSSQADEAAEAAAASLAALATAAATAAAAAAAPAASPVITQTSANRAEWAATPPPDLNLTPPAPLNSETNHMPSSNNSLNMLPQPQPMASVVNSSSVTPTPRADSASGLLLPQPQQQQRHLTQHELQLQQQQLLQAGLQHVVSGSGFYFGGHGVNELDGVGRGSGSGAAGGQLATSYAGLAGGSQQQGWLSHHQLQLQQHHDPQQHFPTHSHHSPLAQAHSFAPWVAGQQQSDGDGAPAHHNTPPVHCHSRGAASQADIGFGGQDVCGPLPTNHPSSVPAEAAAAAPPHRNDSPQDCLSDSGSGAGGYWYAGNHGSSGNSHPTPEAMAASRAAHLAATLHPSSWHALQQSRHPSQQSHHAVTHQQQLQQLQEAEDERMDEQQGSD